MKIMDTGKESRPSHPNSIDARIKSWWRDQIFLVLILKLSKHTSFNICIFKIPFETNKIEMQHMLKLFTNFKVLF